MNPKKYRVLSCEDCEEDERVLVGVGESLKNSIWQTQLENYREIIINGIITDELIEKAVIQIHNINRLDAEQEKLIREYERPEITIFLQSDGGDLAAAMPLCAIMETSKTPIVTVALGKVCSAAFLVLICGGHRYAQHLSSLMYHTGSSGVAGVITDILEYGKYLEGLNNQIHQLVLRHTKIPEELLKEVFERKTDWYVSIPEALEFAVIDGIWGMDKIDLTTVSGGGVGLDS